MIVRSIKTRKVLANDCTIFELLDESLQELQEKSVVAITSKVVSLCEGRVVPMGAAEKDDLIAQETQLYLPGSMNPYNVTLSVTRNLLVAAGGVDESNGAGQYVLWPADPQASANAIREYLCKMHKVRQIGVIITDSTTRPFQRGTTGIAIAYSGFKALKDYRGQKDLFGRPFVYETNSICNGLGAAAALVMGEGSEQTPLAVMTELDFVDFVPRNPTKQELAILRIAPEADVYAPLLQHVPWRIGGQGKS